MFRNVAILSFLLFFAELSAAVADDAVDILGRWNNPIGDAAYIEFYKDGTFKEAAVTGSIKGKYRFTSINTIEFTRPGIFYGEIVEEVKYKLSKESFDRYPFGFSLGALSYKRAKIQE